MLCKKNFTLKTKKPKNFKEQIKTILYVTGFPDHPGTHGEINFLN
jgi:hypothetical protein